MPPSKLIAVIMLAIAWGCFASLAYCLDTDEVILGNDATAMDARNQRIEPNVGDTDITLTSTDAGSVDLADVSTNKTWQQVMTAGSNSNVAATITNTFTINPGSVTGLIVAESDSAINAIIAFGEVLGGTLQVLIAGAVIHDLSHDTAAINASGANLDTTIGAVGDTDFVKVDAGVPGVGIGTAAIGDSLEILPAVGQGITIRESDNGNDAIRIFASATGGGLTTSIGAAIQNQITESLVSLNQTLADVNFSYNTTGEANTLFVDGLLKQVAIGTNAPLDRLDVRPIAGSAGGITVHEDGEIKDAVTMHGKTTGGEIKVFDNALLTHHFADTEFTVNEQGIDIDTRFESVGRSAAFHIQGSNGAVSFGTSTPVDFYEFLTNANVNLSLIGDADNNATNTVVNLNFIHNGQKGTGTQVGLVGFDETTDVMQMGYGATGDLFVDSAGEVGINDSAPDRQLHVNSGTTNEVAKFESTDASATIEIVDSTTANNAAITRTGDDLLLAPAGGNVGVGAGVSAPSGTLHVQPSSGNSDLFMGTGAELWNFRVNASNGRFEIRDGTSAALPFIIQDGAATNAMLIDANSDVAIGAATPLARLYATDSAVGFVANFFNDGGLATNEVMILQGGQDDGLGVTRYISARDGNGDEIGTIENTSGTFQLIDSSSRTRKEGIVDTAINTDDIFTSAVVRDYRRIGSLSTETGFIAEELELVFPSAVHTHMYTKNLDTGTTATVQGIDSGGDPFEREEWRWDTEEKEFKGIAMSKLIPVMFKEIQDLRARIAVLEGP